MTRHREAEIQTACVQWFRYQFPHLAPLLFAVPNGGKRNPSEAAHLKAQGVTPGVSDLILLVPSGNHHGACIEMKAGKGQLTDRQREWLKVAGKQGYYVAICWSVDEFIETIHDYFSQS